MNKISCDKRLATLEAVVKAKADEERLEKLRAASAKRRVAYEEFWDIGNISDKCVWYLARDFQNKGGVLCEERLERIGQLVNYYFGRKEPPDLPDQIVDLGVVQQLLAGEISEDTRKTAEGQVELYLGIGSLRGLNLWSHNANDFFGDVERHCRLACPLPVTSTAVINTANTTTTNTANTTTADGSAPDFDEWLYRWAFDIEGQFSPMCTKGIPIQFAIQPERVVSCNYIRTYASYICTIRNLGISAIVCYFQHPTKQICKQIRIVL
jgi:hypothetical protein